MLYLTESVNLLSFLEGHYLVLALVCKQWYAFIQEQSEDYITYNSVKCQSYSMYSFCTGSIDNKYIKYVAFNRPAEMAQFGLISSSQACPAMVRGMLKCYSDLDDLESVINILENYVRFWNKDLVRYIALKNKDLVAKYGLSLQHLLQVGIENGRYFEYADLVDPDINTLTCAANAGKLAILEHAMEFVDRRAQITSSFATKDDNLEIITLLHEAGYSFNYTIWREAAKKGHSKIIKYAMQSGLLGRYSDDVIETFIAAGDLKMIKWIAKSEYLPRSIHYCGDNEKVFNCLMRYGCSWKDMDIDIAVDSNNMVLFNWLIARGEVMSVDKWMVCRNFEFIKENCPVDAKIHKQIVSQAIENGDLRCLKWMKEMMKDDFAIKSEHIVAASINDQLHVLKWLDKKLGIKSSITGTLLKYTMRSSRYKYAVSSERVLRWALNDPTYTIGDF